MPTDTFRLCYADLMEQYQFVEEQLERLYAALSDKRYDKGLLDVDKASLPAIIKAIQQLEKEQQRSVFTEEECNALSELIKRRNYWAHECFVKLKFKADGTLKYPEDMYQMVADLRVAEEWKEKLFRKQQQYK